MNSNPLRVYYAVSAETDAPRVFDPTGKGWTLRKSSGDRSRTNDLLNRLQGARVQGTHLIEYVRYENTAMWQFLPAYLWLQFFLAVDLIDVIKDIIESVKPAKVRFFPTDDPTSPIWRALVYEMASNSGLPVDSVFERTGRGFRITVRTLLRDAGAGQLVRIFRRGDHPRKGPHSRSATSRLSKSVIFLTFGRRHWVQVPGEPDRMYDEQMYPLLPALRAKGWNDFVMIDTWDLPTEELEKRMRNGEPDVRWRAYSSYREGNLVFRKARPTFFAMWNVIQHDEHFFQDFKYRDIHLMPVLRTVLKRAFLVLLPECAQMLDTAARMIAQESAVAIIASYETGPWARAVLIQAARAGIPTIGLQHGMIFEGDPDNLHLRVTNDPNAPGFMVPEITCVWGPFWKDVLTKAGHYDPESVAITGYWRYDRLSEIRAQFDANQAKSRYAIDASKKVVLFLSAGLETVRYLQTSLETIANRHELVPLIKLHPGVDKPGPVIEMLKGIGVSERVLFQGQLVEALLIADLVVSQYSTAIGEAALVDKPVIMVDLYNFRGGEDYIRSGICLYVTHSGDLNRAIEKALYDQSTRSEMSSSREAFITRYFYKLDGRAAERVVDALEALMEARAAGSSAAPPAQSS